MATGGYEQSFVDSPPDELLCLVCHHVAREAQQVECCGKVFCKTCITEVSERLGSCPNCRKPSPKAFSDLRGARTIKRLKVTCKNQNTGCDWNGPLESYEMHAEECSFEEVTCPNVGCSDTILKGLLEDHLNNACQRRKEECSVCHKIIAHEDMSSHPGVCPNVEIECNNSGCNLRLFRGQLLSHQSVCPKQKITCPYSAAGCTAEILREDKQKHLLENIDHHGIICSTTVSSLRKELTEIRKQLDSALESKVVPPVTFKVANYKHLKEKGSAWYSPSFYTHVRGYKMKLEIIMNPVEEGIKHHHVAAYFILLPGINDGSLFWPFGGEIKFQILNQCQNSGHFLRSVSWTEADEDVTRKPSKGNCNSGWGKSPFIYYSELEKESNSYLQNDCFFIRVLKASIAKQWLTCSMSPSEV